MTDLPERARRGVTTPDAPLPSGRYSQAVIADGLVFLAGQAPILPSGEIVSGSIETQVTQCFANLEAVAGAAGTTLDRAVRISVYLNTGVDMAAYNRIYSELVTADPPPARTTIFSDFPAFDVEIDAICLAGEASGT